MQESERLHHKARRVRKEMAARVIREDGGRGKHAMGTARALRRVREKAKLTTEDTESSESCYFSLCPLRTLWFFNMQRCTRTMRLHRKARRVCEERAARG